MQKKNVSIPVLWNNKIILMQLKNHLTLAQKHVLFYIGVFWLSKLIFTIPSCVILKSMGMQFVVMKYLDSCRLRGNHSCWELERRCRYWRRKCRRLWETKKKTGRKDLNIYINITQEGPRILGWKRRKKQQTRLKQDIRSMLGEH